MSRAEARRRGAFISTTNARELYDLRPGETVADAATRKASENEAEGHP